MPALPLKSAAAELGIKVSKLLQLAEDGTGIIQRGSRGRGHATLFDTTTLAELVPRPSGRARNRRDRARAAQLHRGAMALTLPDAIDDELGWVERMNHLTALGIPKHQQAAVIRFMYQRILGRITEHFRPKIKSAKSRF